MLVLTRKADERFCIHTPDGDVWIQVVQIDRARVRIGVDAPKEFVVRREELDLEPRPLPRSKP